MDLSKIVSATFLFDLHIGYTEALHVPLEVGVVSTKSFNTHADTLFAPIHASYAECKQGLVCRLFC